MGAGEAVRDTGGVDAGEFGALKVCDRNPRPRPRPRVLGVDDGVVEAPRPVLSQCLQPLSIFLILTSYWSCSAIVRASFDSPRPQSLQ